MAVCRNKTFSPLKWSLQDSLCIVQSSCSLLFPDFSLSLSLELLSPPTLYLSSSCSFLALIDSSDSIRRLAVFLSLPLSLSHSTVSWRRYGSCGSLLTTHDSLTGMTSCHSRAWAAELRWRSPQCHFPTWFKITDNDDNLNLSGVKKHADHLYTPNC